MDIFLACLLILPPVLFYLYEVWRRYRGAVDDEVVPDRWNGVSRDLAPKFYWFQIVRMVIVIGICILAVVACIAGGVIGLMGLMR